LAGDGDEHAKLATFFDDLLESFQPVILPALSFAKGLRREDVVGLIDYGMKGYERDALICVNLPERKPG
jgi:hypothetical protein